MALAVAPAPPPLFAGAAPAVVALQPLPNAAEAAAQRAQQRTEAQRFLQVVRAVPWGVLGRQSTVEDGELERAPTPDPGLAFVDPADLDSIKVFGPRRSSGTAAAIYQHLGIQDAEAFASDVSESVRAECAAKWHKYRGRDGREQQVIHCVGPDLRHQSYASSDERKARKALAKAYYSVLQQFIASGLSRLRLPPLSEGICSGGFADKFPNHTISALAMAFSQLDERDRVKLLNAASIELCIFMETELESYRRVLNLAQGADRGGGWGSPRSPPHSRPVSPAAWEARARGDGRPPSRAGGARLSPERLALALAPEIGDEPGSGQARLRVGVLISPRRPAPDVAKASSMQALREEIQRKRPGTAFTEPIPSQDWHVQNLHPALTLSEEPLFEESEAAAAPTEPAFASEAPRGAAAVDAAASVSRRMGSCPTAKLHFDGDWKAKTLRLSPDRAVASWKLSKYGGFALSLQPLQKQVVGRWFEVSIEEVDSSRWSDGLGIGIVSAKPERESLRAHMDMFGNLEGFACELFHDHWMLGYDGDRIRYRGHTRYLTASEMPQGRWRPADLRPGDIVGLLVTPDGHMLLFVNEELILIAQDCTGLEKTWTSSVFAAFDLDGCIKAVRLVDTNGLIPRKVLQIHGRFRDDELHGGPGRPSDPHRQDDTTVQDL